MKAFTIKDIARQAGVSVTTVSRVMNGRPDVNPDTRARVMDIVNACHFVRNENAKTLRQASDALAAIIVRGRQNMFLNDVTERMLQYAAGSRYAFLPTYIDEKDDEFQAARRLCVERHICGCILLGSSVDGRRYAQQKPGVPLVFATVSADKCDIPGASSVSIDEREMGARAADYLLRLGHTRIAVFGGSRSPGDALALRFEGFAGILRSTGRGFDEQLYVETRFSIGDAYETARRFLPIHPDVTAVFTMSDLVAAGVIRALRDMGKRVPDDVSVLGFDGIELGQYFIPSITTVRQPAQQIAVSSVDVLLSMMQGDGQARHVLLPAQLVERESVARART